MIALLFCFGLVVNVLDAVYRLTMSFATFQRLLLTAKAGNVARTKVPMMLLRLIISLVYLVSFQYCRLRYLWLSLGVISLVSSLLWLVTAFRKPVTPSPQIPKDMDEETLRRAFKRNKIGTGVTSVLMLLVWTYSWYGVAFAVVANH